MKRLRVQFFMVGLMGVVSLLTACKGNDMEDIKRVTNTPIGPAESATDVELWFSDSAIVRVQLKSPQVDRYAGKKTYMELPKGLLLTFYKSDRSVSSTLRAKYAISYDETKIMEAKKDVVVVNETGEQLNTEHLIWDQQRKLIYTNEFVKITKADEVIYGQGLESNEDFSRYKIKKISGIINLKSNE